MNLTTEQISLIAQFVVPIVVGIMVRWFGKRVPEAWSKFATSLSPEDIDHAITMIGTATGRRGYVKAELRGLCNKYGISGLISDADIDKIMGYGVRYWNAGIKFAGSRLGK